MVYVYQRFQLICSPQLNLVIFFCQLACNIVFVEPLWIHSNCFFKYVFDYFSGTTEHISNQTWYKYIPIVRWKHSNLVQIRSLPKKVISIDIEGGWRGWQREVKIYLSRTNHELYHTYIHVGAFCDSFQFFFSNHNPRRSPVTFRVQAPL